MSVPCREDPFPKPTPLEKRLLDELVKVAGYCYERGWSWGTAGNFSLRGSTGRPRALIWQSPSGLCKGDLDPRSFIPVDLQTGEGVSPGAGKPSGEMPVHLGAYRSVPWAGAVVHTHPPAIVSASRAGKALSIHGEEMQKALGFADHRTTCRVPVLENPLPGEMVGFAAKVPGAVVEGVPMLVLAAHGVYAWGRTPLEALAFVEALEFICQTGGVSQ